MGETFTATIRLGGKTATGIPVPAQVVERLGTGRRPAVRVTINEGYSYRSTVATMGGEFMLPLSAEHRGGAAVGAGDQVDVRLELDTEPREVTVPADVAEALDGEPEARRFFDDLSYSRKLAYILPIEQAKTPGTRQRRIDKAVTMLREQRIR
jgi:hypothetical protein